MRKLLADTMIIVLVLLAGLPTHVVVAVERERPIHIGVLSAAWGPTPQVVGMRDGLIELGYTENQDFVLGIRFTQGNLAELPSAARDLVQYEADVIVVDTDASAIVAQQTTTQIPIVFTGVGDPVGIGLVKSFSRPGGNVTGVTDLSSGLAAKRLEIFHSIVPGLKRVLFPYDAADDAMVLQAHAYRQAARRLGITLIERPMRTMEEARDTLAQVQKGKIDGILEPPSPALNIPGFVLQAMTDRQIPAIFTGTFWVERGGLAGYGPDFHETGKQAARLMDKIIKGASPAELPVEMNSKIEFTINLKTAKALGLTIPLVVLYQANRIIR